MSPGRAASGEQGDCSPSDATIADDARFLALALELALLGQGQTRPNPMVGSVVVRNGEIIGKGHHPKAGQDHAENRALADAGGDARAATLYTNLEPCAHQGRTPPCTDAIIRGGTKRVVACLRDPDPRVNGKGFAALEEAGIEVNVGLLAEEARKLNEAYFHYLGTGRPFVTVKAGSSLDGRIAAPRREGQAAAGSPLWVTSPQAREEAMRLRGRNDAVLVGIGTVLEDDPLLSVRDPASPRPILRAVLDSGLRTPPACRLLGSLQEGPVVIYHTQGAAAQHAAALRAAGAETVAAGKGARVDLDLVLEDLGRREILALLVEGGGEVIGSFLSRGLVDRICLFLAPSFLGARAVPLVGSAAARPGGRKEEETHPELPLRLDSFTVIRVGSDLLIEGSPSR